MLRHAGVRRGFSMEKDESREASEAQVSREPTDDDVTLVAKQTRAGTDKETIAAMLEDRGLDRVQARGFVDTVYPLSLIHI